MRRVKVLSAFFALAMFVQLGYYFDFIEFVDTNKSPLHDFHLSSFPSSSPSLLAPLHALCNRTKWKPNTYINCSNISTPAFAAINQFQVCIRWAIDAGVNIVRPTFIANDNVSRHNLDYLLQEDYLWQSLQINCPAMKVVESSELQNVHEIEGDNFFFGKRFRGKGSYNKYVQRKIVQNPPPDGSMNKVLQERGSLAGWERGRDPFPIQSSFKSIFRLPPTLITLASRIHAALPRSFFGVHLRAEDFNRMQQQSRTTLRVVNDERDEIGEALAWVLARNTSAYPFVYVSCDDASTLAAFLERARASAVIATHKWLAFNATQDPAALAHAQEALLMLSSLSGDQLRVVDHIVLSKALFYVGTAGSVDSFMLGQSRHYTQYEKLDYHGMDKQQYMLGPGINWWSGATW